MAITRGQEKYLDTATQGKYYLVARDDLQRDFHMGWFDFHDISRKVPKLELSLRNIYTTEMRPGRKPAMISRKAFSWQLFDAQKGPNESDIHGSMLIEPPESDLDCPKDRRRLRRFR
jgi:hypothetical protein